MKAIMEIRAGEGGNDSKLFIKDMLRMYERYCSNNDINIELLDSSDSSFILELDGDIKLLRKYESGTHRVQRVPPTESKGRRHSSTITVAILEIPVGVKGIEMKDIEFKPCKGQGPGGQHRNKTESGIRATHRPTGIVALCTNGRSQWTNKQAAIRVLSARVLERNIETGEEVASEERKKQIGRSGRAEKIRTYNFCENRIKDARLRKTLHCLDKVMDGALEKIYKLI